MKGISLALIFAITGAAMANIDHAQLINKPGQGTGAIAGGDLSQLETGELNFGLGAQKVGTTTSNIVADDFQVSGGGFIVDKICFFTYQTGATATSITGVNYAIGGSATTSLTTASSFSVNWWNPNGVGVYRNNVGDTTSSNRRIQVVEVDVTDFTLGAGTHFLSFQFTGSLASGPWCPPLPTSNASHGLNALQSINGGAFAAVGNGTVGGQAVGCDLPFIVKGQAVPEPATMSVLALGALAAIRRRNRK